jgi:methionyl-tRNA synthetase
LEELSKWLRQKWKPNVLNFAKSYAEDLKPRAITRDAEWESRASSRYKRKVLYVWFDAPIGYISATKEWAEKAGIPMRGNPIG